MRAIVRACDRWMGGLLLLGLAFLPACQFDRAGLAIGNPTADAGVQADRSMGPDGTADLATFAEASPFDAPISDRFRSDTLRPDTLRPDAPSPGPPDDLWVKVGATGGDGSYAMPYGSVGLALCNGGTYSVSSCGGGTPPGSCCTSGPGYCGTQGSSGGAQTIHVLAGSYSETVVLGPRCSLVGFGPTADQTITPAAAFTGYSTLFVTDGTGVRIANLTFKSGLANHAPVGCAPDFDDGGAICWAGGGGTIDHCDFNGNSATNNGSAIAFYLNAGATTTVDDCTFESNSATGGGGYSGKGTVALIGPSSGMSTLALTNDLFDNNTAQYGAGVFV